MKRLIALVLCLFLVPAASAATVGSGRKATDAPLVDPASQYESFVDPEDPASGAILRMLDSVNDEHGFADGGYAVHKYEYEVDAEGGISLLAEAYMYQTDYGYVIQMTIPEMPEGAKLYAFAHRSVGFANGALFMTLEAGYLDDLDGDVSSMLLNEYDPAETLLAVRETEDGYAFLSMPDEERRCEYITDARLRYTELRTYEADAEGTLRLAIISWCELVDPPALPEGLGAAMK